MSKEIALINMLDGSRADAFETKVSFLQPR